MPLRSDDETDRLDDEASDDEADDALEDEKALADDADAEDDEDGEPLPQDEPPRLSWRERMRRRARGHGGMGRRSTGPAPRPAAAPVPEAPVSAETAPPTEMAPDVSTWPGTADAAKMVGRHVSTIKLWRAQGRIRAVQDEAGCWRHHPDDLAESVDTPDATDAGSVLAQGMTAIVAQGASANERLLTMTEIATTGLQTAAGVLSTELERAYAKIAELEAKVAELTEKLAATRELDLKHERYMRRLDQKHELAVAGAHETSERLNGLLTIVGPIAASMAARLIGNLGMAEKIEARAVGASPSPPDAPAAPSSPEVSPPHPGSPPAAGDPQDDRLVPIETRITDAMSRLCIAIRSLDGPAFQGLRAMMPLAVQDALDDIMHGTSDSAVGQALAVLIKAAQGLSDLQFQAIRPIAPADIANVLAELRQLIRVKEDQPS